MIAAVVSVFLIAVSLAIDACAVSVCTGISVPGFRPRHAVKVAIFCGVFQFLMPLIGWLLGTSVAGYIDAVGPYIALLLLVATVETQLDSLKALVHELREMRKGR